MLCIAVECSAVLLLLQTGRFVNVFKMSAREEAIQTIKQRVQKLREKAEKESTDEDLTRKITDVFNGE